MPQPPTPVVKVKTFESEYFHTEGDGGEVSLQDQMNGFLQGMSSKNIISVYLNAFSSSKYGMKKTYVGAVVYLE